MPSFFNPSRRDILKAGAAGAAGTALAGLGLGGVARAQAPLTVGFIYVGPRDDFGYNQAHAQGANVVKAMPGVTVVEEENVPETNAVQQSMLSMIQFDGARLLFPTSFGYYDPHVLTVARQRPNVQFRHCGQLWIEGQHPANAGTYFGYIGMGQYLNGIVAGHTSRTKRIGFVAAKPIPQVLININSFALGARSVDPTIQCQVIFTGEWSLAVREAEAVNSLVDQGADVLTCHVDGPKVMVETANNRGAYVCGYHANQSSLAPMRYLTGAEWNWGPLYTSFVSTMQNGGVPPNFARGGLADGFVNMSPYGPAVSDAARANADAVKAEIMAGGYSVFKGELKDNRGNIVIPAGQSYVETDVALESMNYLVEGVLGSTS